MAYFDTDKPVTPCEKNTVQHVHRIAMKAAIRFYLTERERIVMLHRLNNMSFRDIALMMKLSCSTIKRISQRATVKLKRLVDAARRTE